VRIFLLSWQSNLAHYIERWRGMPSNAVPPVVTTAAGTGVNTLYYSWDAGLVHYIALDTELTTTQGDVTRAAMLRWLRQDLTKAHANRERVPWVRRPLRPFRRPF
jgi:hypothetical protein